MKKVYLISGDKGGVGKSWVATALVEYLKECGKTITIIETDMSNYDVGAPYTLHPESGISVVGIDLTKQKGSELFLDTVLETESDCIVINSRATGNDFVESQIAFYENLAELDCDLTVIWSMFSEKDCVVALKKFCDGSKVDYKNVIVSLNLHSTQGENDFSYHRTDFCEKMRAGGVREMFFPVLPKRISEQIRNDKETFESASISTVNKLCAKTFLKRTYEAFKSVNA